MHHLNPVIQAVADKPSYERFRVFPLPVYFAYPRVSAVVGEALKTKGRSGLVALGGMIVNDLQNDLVPARYNALVMSGTHRARPTDRGANNSQRWNKERYWGVAPVIG
jgi:hypothetical protein